MRSSYALLLLAVLAFPFAGCGLSSGDGAAESVTSGDATAGAAVAQTGTLPEPTDKTPEGAVTVFLESVRKGDDKKTESMFSTLAQQQIKQLEYHVTPPGSDTAKFDLTLTLSESAQGLVGAGDELFAQPDIDGALVGGASLKVDEMAGIVARAGITAAARAAAA